MTDRAASGGSRAWRRRTSRIVLEKPIGRDLASSRAINDGVGAVFDEQRTFRIDHYLGKETVQNLLVLRFANMLVEPVWSRATIDHVQITVAEEIGVEGRARLLRQVRRAPGHGAEPYSAAPVPGGAGIAELDGCRRDPHRETESAFGAAAHRCEGRRARRPCAANTRRASSTAQRRRATPKKSASRRSTETFVAIKAEVDNWRWAGVPFYLRTGKRMGARRSEIVVQFKDTPVPIFGAGAGSPNRLVLRLQPDEGVRLVAQHERAGAGRFARQDGAARSLVRGRVRRALSGRVRAAADGCRARQSLAVHAPRRSRRGVGRGPTHCSRRGTKPAASRIRTRPARMARRNRRCCWIATAAPGGIRSDGGISNVKQRSQPSSVTERIRARSAKRRRRYLDLIDALRRDQTRAREDRRSQPRARRRRAARCRTRSSCSAANGRRSASSPPTTTCSRRMRRTSAIPAIIRKAAREVGAVAQVAGGVPAMCDGVTQGFEGMELSLFSRDVIALSTAVSLSHATFDAALLLGICDKIVPGLLIGALRFPWLPVILVPGGPMPSGLPNKEKAARRQLFAEGKIGREELLQAEAESLSRAGHVHVLRHRQLQSDDDGADGPASARARRSSIRTRRCAMRSPSPRRSAPRRSPGSATTIARSAASSMRRRSSTPWSA